MKICNTEFSIMVNSVIALLEYINFAGLHLEHVQYDDNMAGSNVPYVFLWSEINADFASTAYLRLASYLLPLICCYG